MDKICSHCHLVKPASAEYFYRNRGERDGLAQSCKECYRAVSDKKRAIRNARNRQLRADRRYEVIDRYSEGQMCCACCGETQLEFLCIDHIGGGGSRHRREVAANNLSRWLIRNNFPPGFRVLCLNCNGSLGYWGYCPHNRNKVNGKGAAPAERDGEYSAMLRDVQQGAIAEVGRQMQPLLERLEHAAERIGRLEAENEGLRRAVEDARRQGDDDAGEDAGREERERRPWWKLW